MVISGIFPLERGLNGHWGHVLPCPSAMSRTSASQLSVGTLYNLSQPQDCPSIDLIKFAKRTHSTVPASQEGLSKV